MSTNYLIYHRIYPGTTLTQEMAYLVATGDFQTALDVHLDDRFPIIDVKDERFPYYRGIWLCLIIH